MKCRRKSLNNAVVCYCQCFMPEAYGLVNKSRNIRHRIHCRKLCMEMQFDSFYGLVVSSFNKFFFKRHNCLNWKYQIFAFIIVIIDTAVNHNRHAVFKLFIQIFFAFAKKHFRAYTVFVIGHGKLKDHRSFFCRGFFNKTYLALYGYVSAGTYNIRNRRRFNVKTWTVNHALIRFFCFSFVSAPGIISAF